LNKRSQRSLLVRRHGQNEFEVLCTLLANSLVVPTDETRWSINRVWAFLSEKARVVLFGVHQDAQTLEPMLDPKTFTGLVLSDDAAV
jgi:transposase